MKLYNGRCRRGAGAGYVNGARLIIAQIKQTTVNIYSSRSDNREPLIVFISRAADADCTYSYLLLVVVTRFTVYSYSSIK